MVLKIQQFMYKYFKYWLFVIWFLLPIIISLGCVDDNSEEDVVMDIDGNIYHTVNIGEQVWMIENLKTTKFRDGTPIKYEPNFISWMNAGIAYCSYENNETNKNTYGALYNWSAVNSGKLCPEGWRVPNEEDWNILAEYLGGKDKAGGKLKESGTNHWSSPNTGATNKSRFTALPGGNRGDDGFDGNFTKISTHGYWWSSDEYTHEYAYFRSISYKSEYLSKGHTSKMVGLSVRCIKN